MVDSTFTITNPLTGLPLKETSDGISLEGVTFPNKESAEKFVFEHWPAAVLTAEIPDRS